MDGQEIFRLDRDYDFQPSADFAPSPSDAITPSAPRYREMLLQERDRLVQEAGDLRQQLQQYIELQQQIGRLVRAIAPDLPRPPRLPPEPKRGITSSTEMFKFVNFRVRIGSDSTASNSAIQSTEVSTFSLFLRYCPTDSSGRSKSRRRTHICLSGKSE
jgi:hypothetical protein